MNMRVSPLTIMLFFVKYSAMIQPTFTSSINLFTLARKHLFILDGLRLVYLIHLYARMLSHILVVMFIDFILSQYLYNDKRTNLQRCGIPLSEENREEERKKIAHRLNLFASTLILLSLRF